MRLVSVLLLILLQDNPRFFDPAVHESTRTIPFDQFFIVPVRVHRLLSKEDDALDCRLKDEDIRRIFGKVNRIWNKAGLAIGIESITPETAVHPADFDEDRLQDFRGTRPSQTHPAGMIHLYYVHRLPTNGVFMGPDAIFVKDTASLRPVKGGVDEPLPRVSSHEIGHAMGLAHRQDTINLMASGTTGWSINDGEIDTVRSWAQSQDWVLRPEAALEKGYRELIASLPGDSELQKKARAATTPPPQRKD